MNEETAYIVAVGLRNEMTMHVEVRDLGGRQKVSDFKALSLQNVVGSIEVLVANSMAF
jgi:hypothetical protein